MCVRVCVGDLSMHACSCSCSRSVHVDVDVTDLVFVFVLSTQHHHHHHHQHKEADLGLFMMIRSSNIYSFFYSGQLLNIPFFSSAIYSFFIE